MCDLEPFSEIRSHIQWVYLEPFLKDTSKLANRGHNTFNVSIKDNPLQYHGNTISPLKEQNLSITVNSCQKLLVSKRPLFRGSTVRMYVYYDSKLVTKHHANLYWSIHAHTIVINP